MPSWAKDPTIGNRMINARMETVAEKPAFKRAFARRRCLLPADGYFEWYGEVKGKKQPFFIRPKRRRRAGDGGPLRAVAGQGAPEDTDAPWLWTCTVLTTSAAGRPRPHPRPDAAAGRAGSVRATGSTLPATTRRAARAAGARRTRAGCSAYPVATDVNNVRNNGPHLVEPHAPAEGAVAEGAAADDATADADQPELF